MGVVQRSVNERRLAHVREIREQFYGDDKTDEEVIAEQQARIQELTAEVEQLRELLRPTQRPEPEDPASRRTFDFYRD